jgi:pyruvate formate lyase activating enzyme
LTFFTLSDIIKKTLVHKCKGLVMKDRQFDYYTPKEGTKIVCNLCQHSCELKEGQVGICSVNQNEKGKLKTLVYGHPVAIHIDPVEKKPLYHLLPNSKVLSFGTVGCNFKCPFCQNWDISQSKEINEQVIVSPEQMVALAIEHDAKSIAYTYNEPTIFYPYARDIGIVAKERGIKNIFVSNGFESSAMVDDMASWVDAANIDLKSWDDGYYKKVLKGGLEEVKATLKQMVQSGIWVEVTTLLIEGHNDSDEQIASMAQFIAQELGRYVPWHLSAFYPNYKMKEHSATKLSTLLKAKTIAKKLGLQYIYLGNVGVEENTKCPHCKSLLISRSGYGNIIEHSKDGKCLTCSNIIEGVWK